MTRATPRATPRAFALLTALVLLPGPALAYIGPGMTGGAIAAVLGVIAAVVMAILALAWYPIKRALGIKSRRKSARTDEGAPEE